jgi:hypothetical protein
LELATEKKRKVAEPAKERKVKKQKLLEPWWLPSLANGMWRMLGKSHRKNYFDVKASLQQVLGSPTLSKQPKREKGLQREWSASLFHCRLFAEEFCLARSLFLAYQWFYLERKFLDLKGGITSEKRNRWIDDAYPNCILYVYCYTYKSMYTRFGFVHTWSIVGRVLGGYV